MAQFHPLECDKPKEECGVFGIHTTRSKDVAPLCNNALIALQHRGQESAGIALQDGRRIVCDKGPGLVSDVFSEPRLHALGPAKNAIGHVRYSTTGASKNCNAQPIIVGHSHTGEQIALSHNGNIINAANMREKLCSLGYSFSCTSDSEVMAVLIDHELRSAPSLEEAVIRAAKQLVGAFSVALLGHGKLIALRDPSGFRPLCVGKNASAIAFASESCALDAVDIPFLRDIAPGELISVDQDGAMHSIFYDESAQQGVCIFEFVYFARSDSVIDGQSVYAARYNTGKQLALEHPADADIVCGVPDSGIDAAHGYAAQSGIPFASAFVKNRYIGRSFIIPTQAKRVAAVRLKLNPLAAVVAGKRIVLIDDSIVRGTTSAGIIAALRNAGAKQVHLRISSPPFHHACYFGTDIDDPKDLIANQMSLDGIARHIGVDSLGFVSSEGLRGACGELPFCMGCFSGRYPVDTRQTHAKEAFER